MIVLRFLEDFRRWRFKHVRKGERVGFVPTMGYLHEGHLSLIRRARRECDVVIVSIFVNPIQFGPKEDFERYPRDEKRDLALCRKEGVDAVFLPKRQALYPADFQTYVEMNLLTQCLCGPKRPGHFKGVATVVAKLFHLVKPDTAYFGQKDFQQALVVRQMVKDLNMGIRIRICPTIRERDGLAMSSRNVYLNPGERLRARSLFESLRLARGAIQRGVRDPKKIHSLIRQHLSRSGAKVDYVEIRSAADLSAIRKIRGRIVIALACFVGRTRLIDNCVVRAG